MPEHSHSFELLERYLDGLLSDEERAEFERRLQTDPALAAELDRQHAVDESLRRLFAPPVMRADMIVSAQRNGRGLRLVASSTRPRRWLAPLSAAAVLVLAIVIGWYNWPRSPTQPVDPYAPKPWKSMADVYRTESSDGFVPDWVCRDDRQFAGTFRRRLGQPLLVAQAQIASATGWGISYWNCVSEDTVCVLARIDETPIMVFVDRAESDATRALPPAEAGLHWFRRDVGALSLYELSPLDSPRLLDAFYLPADEAP